MASRDIYQSTFDEDVQQSSQDPCPECNGRVRTNVHETVCEDCGLVLEDQAVDHGPEWRSFNADDRKRTGAPNTVARHDRGIGSEIGRKTDGNGRAIDGSKRRRLQRLRRRHSRAKTGGKANRNRIAGFTEIRRLIGALGVPTGLREQTCQLFATAQDADLLQGRSIEAVASACLYAVCRLDGHPRTFDDIATVSKVPQDRVEQSYSVINRQLDLPVPPADPRAYLPQIASRLDADQATERTARRLLDAVDSQVLAGKKPFGVAAGALYLAGQQTGALHTQAAVADAADVAIPTVRARFRALQDLTG